MLDWLHECKYGLEKAFKKRIKKDERFAYTLSHMHSYAYAVVCETHSHIYYECEAHSQFTLAKVVRLTHSLH